MVCNTVLDFDCGTIHSIFHINLHEQFVLQRNMRKAERLSKNWTVGQEAKLFIVKVDLHELVFE